MKHMKSMISGLTALSFVASSVMPVYAQEAATASNASSAPQVISGINNIVSQLGTLPQVMSQSPQQAAMQSAMDTIKQKMNKCATDALLDSSAVKETKEQMIARLTKSKKIDQSKREAARQAKKAGKDAPESSPAQCYEEAIAKQKVCESKCSAPEDTITVCSEVSTSSRPKDTATWTAYFKYLEAQKDCDNKQVKELEAQQKILDCQMAVLNAGVSEASTALQSALDANSQKFGQMSQYMAELGAQGQQVDALIGKDGKLTALASALNESYGKMNQAAAEFKNRAEKLETDTKQNEAFLKTAKARTFASCLLGGSVTTGAKYCWRPATQTVADKEGKASTTAAAPNKNGCPVWVYGMCSPAQAAQWAIEKTFVMNANGKPYQDVNRCAQASQAASKFQNTMNDMQSNIGSTIFSWSDIQRDYGSQIDSKALGELSAGAQGCTSKANNWARDAQNPTKYHEGDAKTYADNKQTLDKTKRDLSAELDTNLSIVGRGYSDVLSAIGGPNVALNRSQCTNDNPSTMSTCYTSVNNQLKLLLDGGSNAAVGNIKIDGGTMVGGKLLTGNDCNGLNVCMRSLGLMRESLVKQSSMAAQARQKFVTDGNNGIQNQVKGFGAFLAGAQSTMLAQYDKMKAAFQALGIQAPGSLKRIEGKAFAQEKGENGVMGPFQAPEGGLLAALSSGVQPGGLVDFSDQGLGDSMKEFMEKAKDKKEARSKAIADAKAEFKEIKEKWESCDTAVVSDTSDCDSCRERIENCQVDEKSTDFYGKNADILQQIADGASRILKTSKSNSEEALEMQTIVDSLSPTKGLCQLVKRKCSQCFSSHLKGGDRSVAESGKGGAKTAKDD